MQPFYWLCEPPHNEGGLIWPVNLCDSAEKRNATNSRFIPKPEQVKTHVLPFLKSACGPLYFATSLEKGKGHVIDNGSFGLVGTSKKDLLVTCYHVWNGFLKKREQDPGLKLCACFDDRYPVPICTLPDGTDNEPIDKDEKLDIAVFDLEPFKAYCGEHKMCAILNSGPQIQIKEKDTVGIVGQPGRFRVEVEQGISFGREPYIGFISSISGYKYFMDFTRVMDFERNLLVKKWDRNNIVTKGISGSPCFIILPNYQLSLIGIVTAHVGWDSVPDNFVQVTTSNCINEDGTLKTADSFYGTP
jgi:hypothetical protein